MKNYKVLAMNFGSTSTKVAVYEGDERTLSKTVQHNTGDMDGLVTMADNAAFRKPFIIEALREEGIEMTEFDAIIGRGGLVRPIPGGTYAVNEQMVKDLSECTYGKHASNLGGILAYELASAIGKPAFIVDPVVVDEMQDVARLSGHPDYPRRPIFHALNQKAVAKRYAAEKGVPYDSLNVIVCHMGGGVSVGAHEKGRIIDVNNGLEGDGPYSTERSGGLTVFDVLRLANSGKYGKTFDELRQHLNFDCGLKGYTGTNSGIEISERVKNGDKQAELAYRGFAYQVGKEIGAAAAVLKGKVDTIILTGGFAFDKELMGWISEYVSFIAPVTVYPGEDEMQALAQGGIRVLKGEEEAKTY